MYICCGIVLFCPEKKMLIIIRIMLNEMWVKCSGLSYFSLLIAWEAGSSFYLHGISGWSIYSKENSSFYLEEIEWGLLHFLLFLFFFSQFEDTWIHSPFSYLHNFHSAFCSNVSFVFSGLYSHRLWPDCLPVMETLLPTNIFLLHISFFT